MAHLDQLCQCSFHYVDSTATMMDATRTTVAHTVTVANGMPLAAISAR